MGSGFWGKEEEEMCLEEAEPQGAVADAAGDLLSETPQNQGFRSTFEAAETSL